MTTGTNGLFENRILYVNSNASNDIHVGVPLSGTADLHSPKIQVSPASLDFGAVASFAGRMVTSTPQLLKVTNAGSVP